LACRRCLSLRYPSQGAGELNKTRRKLARLTEKLGPDYTRPEGMHWSTYKRLVDSAFALLRTVSDLEGAKTRALMARFD
jgi:hypothetical protein